jgi:hypothetical protein
MCYTKLKGVIEMYGNGTKLRDLLKTMRKRKIEINRGWTILSNVSDDLTGDMLVEPIESFPSHHDRENGYRDIIWEKIDIHKEMEYSKDTFRRKTIDGYVIECLER